MADTRIYELANTKTSGSIVGATDYFVLDNSVSGSNVTSKAAANEVKGFILEENTIPAGSIVGTTDTQTLTNKTFTTPKINEAVNLTATSTELNQLDGIDVGGTSTGDIVTIDDTQNLTNKTFGNPIITGSIDMNGVTVRGFGTGSNDEIPFYSDMTDYVGKTTLTAENFINQLASGSAASDAVIELLAGQLQNSPKFAAMVASHVTSSGV